MDLGNRFAAAAFVESGTTPQAARVDGHTSIPNTVFVDDDGQAYVGYRGQNREYKNPSSSFRDYKEALARRPREPLGPSGTTPFDCVTALIGELKRGVVQSSPVVAAGIEKDECECAFTLPSDYGEEVKKLISEAASLNGLKATCFLHEPIAAARNILSRFPDRLSDGKRLLLLDVGSRTSDVETLLNQNGTLHQGARGTSIFTGGVDFTGDIYLHICDEHGYEKLKRCFEPGKGFSFAHSELSELETRQAMKLESAAEKAKIEICNTGSAEFFCELPDGVKEISIPTETADSLWKPRIETIADSVSTMIDSLPPDQKPDVLVLVGGGANIRNLKERMSLAAQIAMEDVVHVPDSELVIALGAAEYAVTGSTGTAVQNKAIGVLLRRKDSGDEIVKQLVPSGTEIGHAGIRVESDQQFIESKNGSAVLTLQCVEVHAGVSPYEINGEFFVAPENTSPLGTCRFEFTGLPPGRQRLAMQFLLQNGIPQFSLRPTDTEQEPQQASLLDSDVSNNEHSPAANTHLILLADTSISMKRDVATVQQAIETSVVPLAKQGIPISLISFGSKVHTLISNCDNADAIRIAVDAFDASGSTNMAEAIERVQSVLVPAARNIVLLYTDGHPNSSGNTILASQKLRDTVDKVVTFGIGAGADHSLLKNFVASSPEDHFEGTPDEIPVVFSNVVDLYLLEDESSESETKE